MEFTSIDDLVPHIGTNVRVTVPIVDAAGIVERTGKKSIAGRLVAVREDTSENNRIELFFDGPANQFAMPYLSVTTAKRTKLPTIETIP